jgi:ABC-type multidrug transport system fused ATPase/permease subunit
LPRTLDYSATWAETTASLAAHKEGLAAIAGLMIFIPNWIQGMVIRQLDLDSVKPGPAFWALIGQHFSDYWYVYLPIMLLSIAGSASIYALLTRKDLPRIGDALTAGLVIAPFCFLSQLVTGLGVMVALLAFIVPGLYVSARLIPALPALVAQPSRGPIGVILYAWDLTRNNGWAVFGLIFVVALVAGISMLVVQLISNLVITVITGPEGVPLLQTGISAATETVVAVLMAALGAAIYHQLSAQEA